MKATDFAKEFVSALQAAAESQGPVKVGAYLEKAAAALDCLKNSDGELESEEYWRDQVRRVALLDAAERLPKWRSEIDEGRRPELGPLVMRLRYGRDWVSMALGENLPDGPTAEGFYYGGKMLDLPARQSRLLTYLWQNRRAKRDALYQAVHGKPRKLASDGLPNLADRLKKACRKKGLRITISFPRRSGEVVLDVASNIGGDTHDTQKSK